MADDCEENRLPLVIRVGFERDHKLVYNSWINAMFAATRDAKVSKSWVAASHGLLVKTLLSTRTLHVACNGLNEDDLYGYIVFNSDKRRLYWIYVKEKFRNEFHIASMLMRSAFDDLGARPIACLMWTPSMDRLRGPWDLVRDTGKLNAAVHECP